MKSTTTSNGNAKQKEPGRFGSFFKRFFGGEFLLGKKMRPVYIYIAFLFVLVAIMIVSEQRIREKNRKINKLEIEYKNEISRLKANNQFIPYEQNKVLIQTMIDRGYVFDERHDYTVTVRRPVEEKRHLFKRKKQQDEKE